MAGKRDSLVLLITGLLGIIISFSNNLLTVSICVIFYTLAFYLKENRKLLLWLTFFSILPLTGYIGESSIIIQQGITDTSKLLLRIFSILFFIKGLNFTLNGNREIFNKFLPEDILVSINISMNILPILLNYISESWHQLLLRKNYLFLLPALMRNIFSYAYNFAENLSFEIEQSTGDN